VVLGSDRNIKITSPATWTWPASSCPSRPRRRRRSELGEYRTGIGWDVHSAHSRPAARSGGVASFRARLDGHSDADVLRARHHRCPARRGRPGDIGLHFPDTDPRWAGAESSVFLRHALELASDRALPPGERRLHRPARAPQTQRLPHRHPREAGRNLSLIWDRVSVKFKTSEKLGPVGDRAPPKPRPS